ncbi:hypothetical protein PYW07_016798 [Mythimna separata]|uniref:Uncharacterized protein n=1 Tax=Mythimna separata TaxID=271217 RepID=A0AAD7YL98_MYTSE|nr:hypothetical protein PYW07_016798 [Mythimna separata]
MYVRLEVVFSEKVCVELGFVYTVWSMAPWLRLLAALVLLLLQTALAEPPRCPPHAAGRCALTYSTRDPPRYDFSVDGIPLQIIVVDGINFALTCWKNLTLDNSAMPRFESQLRVSIALLTNCSAPRGSYGAELQRLNVAKMDELYLYHAGNLTRAHLSDLRDLQALELVGAELAPRTLAALAGVRRLTLDRVRLPPGELLQLPSSLEHLELTRVGANVSHDVLERLPKLVKVRVRGDSRVTNNVPETSHESVAVAGALRDLSLERVTLSSRSALSPELRNLTVFGWDEYWPEPWTSCALNKLILNFVQANELPPFWVSECKELRVLIVRNGPRLGAVHETSLRGARRLRELRLASCALTALPARLLADAADLVVLDLSGNFLKELPGDLFLLTPSLQVLDLSWNQFPSEVYTELKKILENSGEHTTYTVCIAAPSSREGDRWQ